MKPKSIEEMWVAYTVTTGLTGPDVAPERHEEVRRAFYAGLFDMFAALNQVSNLSEKEANDTLAAWGVEFNKYANDLIAQLSGEQPPES